MTHSLEVYLGERCVFAVDGKWLYPLFELEQFLADSSLRRERLVVADRIVGKAAAMFMVHLGVRSIRAETMSELALQFLQQRGVTCAYDRLVARIACQTEDLLADETDPERASALIRERRHV